MDGQLIDAGVSSFHEAGFFELPILVPIGSLPLSCWIVRLVGETHRDSIFLEGSDFFD